MANQNDEEDPFCNLLSGRITLVETCEECRETTGCVVIIEKRFIQFKDECSTCPLHRSLDCKASCTARLAQVPTLCEGCRKGVH